jgi:hypothetical protein
MGKSIGMLGEGRHRWRKRLTGQEQPRATAHHSAAAARGLQPKLAVVEVPENKSVAERGAPKWGDHEAQGVKSLQIVVCLDAEERNAQR